MSKQGEIARRPAWPEDTVFRRLVLDVESNSCEHCGATLCNPTEYAERSALETTKTIRKGADTPYDGKA